MPALRVYEIDPMTVFVSRWTHLPQVFQVGKLSSLTDLGYLCSEDSCSRLIETYLIESTKTKISFTLEQIGFKMIDSIGAENSMKILIEKSSNFQKGTFSTRYFHIVKLRIFLKFGGIRWPLFYLHMNAPSNRPWWPSGLRQQFSRIQVVKSLA